MSINIRRLQTGINLDVCARSFYSIVLSTYIMTNNPLRFTLQWLHIVQFLLSA